MKRRWIATVRRAIANWGDPALAVLVVSVGLFEIWVTPVTPPGYRGPDPVATAGVLVLGAAVLWRRRSPVLCLGLVVAVLTVQWAYARGVAQLPNGAFIAVLLLAYTVGAHDERRRGLIAMLTAASLFLIQDGADLEAGYHSVRQDLGFYVLFFLSWSAGLGIGSLRDRAEKLEQLTTQLEKEREERARLAVVEERTRLARELHDVVAHAVTVMVLHSGAARQVVDTQPERAKSTLVSAEDSGRQALAELRRMLGVLRGRADGELRPPEGLRDLYELSNQIRGGGVDVDVVTEGEPRELEPGLDLSAYRIIQEALTNVLKHAQAQRATVRVSYGDRALELEVVDDGASFATDGLGGHGLDGLRERAALYGGTLQARPRPDGGFQVNATLPFNPP